MNNLVYEFLAKTNNNPHEAWDEYIKYHLVTGKALSEDIKGIKDFIKASNPKQETIKKKVYTKKSTMPMEYKMSIEEVMTHLIQIIKLEEEQIKIDLSSKLFRDNAKNTWSSLQANKILLCKITGKEYICEGYPI